MALFKVLTVEKIPLRASPVPCRGSIKNFKHLHGITLSELPDKTVGLLIGLNASNLFRPLETRFGPMGTPDAIKTILGWTLFGPALDLNDYPESYVGSTCMHASLTSSSELDTSSPLENVQPNELTIANSREDRMAYERMKNSIKMIDGHFLLPLLWKQEGLRLPKNRQMVENRLASLKKRLSRDTDTELHSKYNEVMESYLEKGYAEKVETNSDSAGSEWYLPHFPVFNPHKPEKLRIVFGCAAKRMGFSLNDALSQGPDLMNSLVEVLTRFRKEPVALVADIKEMFHQVMVDPADCNYLKFLWWPKGDLSKNPTIYRMAVHLFGASSSPSCASFCLKQTALFACEKSPAVAGAIKQGFYVDDCLMLVATEEEAVDLMREMKATLYRCGFNLTKWTSNKRVVVDRVPVEDRSKVSKLQTLGETVGERVLGVHWDLTSDEFQIKVNIPDKPFTRRGILSMSHSMFDPLGFVSPVLIEVKLLLGELGELGWNDRISEDQIVRWKKWLASLQHLEKLRINRCFKVPGLTGKLTYELHYFAVASTVAYGAASYLRMIDDKGEVHCSFVMGKYHLAPFRPITVPRLELLAAVTTIRLDGIVKQELGLPISKTFCWSDSTAVLQSIYNSRKHFPVFVANRLAEIERTSEVQSWRYVPSALNPADKVSRGVSAEALVESARWLTGPEFLHSLSEEWPQNLEKLQNRPHDFPLFERKIEPVQSCLL